MVMHQAALRVGSVFARVMESFVASEALSNF